MHSSLIGKTYGNQSVVLRQVRSDVGSNPVCAHFFKITMEITEVKVKIGGFIVTLKKFGDDFICVNPPYGFDKQSKEYLALKSFLRKSLRELK